MDIRFWGVRGSCAQSGPEFQKGGHTPCISIHNRDEVVLFDAGTGLVNFNRWFAKYTQKNVHILLSHLHFDHVIGLPFFASLWHGKHDFNCHIYSTVAKDFGGLEHTFKELIKPPYFPISIKQAAHPIYWHDIHNQKPYTTTHGQFQAIALNHPGGSSGYAYLYNDKRVVYLSDSGELKGSDYDNLVKFIRGANLLICDTCFTEEESQQFPTWGHGTANYACTLAKDGDVQQLALFHHGLYHTDETLQEIETSAKAQFPGAFLATQDMKITV